MSAGPGGVVDGEVFSEGGAGVDAVAEGGDGLSDGFVALGQGDAAVAVVGAGARACARVAALVRVGPRAVEHARPLWLLTLPELATNSRVRAFMDHVREAFRARQDALAGAELEPEATPDPG